MAAAPERGHADLNEQTLMAFAEQAGIPDLEKFRGDMLSDRFDEAIAHFEKTLSINPNHAQAHNNLATVFKEIGRFDEAAAHYQKALAINPGDAEVYSNLGSVMLELKRYDAAAEATLYKYVPSSCVPLM